MMDIMVALLIFAMLLPFGLYLLGILEDNDEE